MPRPDGPQFIAFNSGTPKPNWDHLTNDQLHSIGYNQATTEQENPDGSLDWMATAKEAHRLQPWKGASADMVPTRNWTSSDRNSLPVHVQNQLDWMHSHQPRKLPKRSKSEMLLELNDPSVFDYPEKMN